MKKVLLGIFSFLFVACSGWNSELTTKDAPGNKDLKPQCSFHIENNCWTQSLNSLNECLPSTTQPEYFTSPSLRTCSDGAGKLVEFTPKFNKNLTADSLMSFEVSNQGKLCFSYLGTAQNFELINAKDETAGVATLENGDKIVSCFDGQRFLIPVEAQELGCRGTKLKVSNYLPGISLSSSQDAVVSLEDQASQSFAFRLMGISPVQAFNCAVQN